MEDYRTYVTPEIARLAISEGFPASLCELVGETRRGVEIGENEFTIDNYFIRRVPMAEQVINWLRIKYGIIVSMGTGFNCDYKYKGTAYFDSKLEYGKGYQSNDYDEMVNGVLKVALEMIKES